MMIDPQAPPPPPAPPELVYEPFIPPVQPFSNRTLQETREGGVEGDAQDA